MKNCIILQPLCCLLFCYCLAQSERPCVDEIREYIGGKVNLKCAEDGLLQNLRNVKYVWKGESTAIHPVYNFKDNLQINYVSAKTTGAFECKATGIDNKGREEVVSFYHYVMPYNMPTFFVAYKVTYNVGTCYKSKLDFARRELDSMATPPAQCHRYVTCRSKPTINCSNGVAVISFYTTINSNSLGGPYVWKNRHGNKPGVPPHANTEIKKITQGLSIHFYVRRELKDYFGRGRPQAGFGYTCKNGYFSENTVMTVEAALKHGRKGFVLPSCIPCPAGTMGYNGKCEECPPMYYNNRIGVHNSCQYCTKNIDLMYYGARSEAECASTEFERPPGEYPESCTHTKFKYH